MGEPNPAWDMREEFRADLAKLGLSQHGLARLMSRLGDTRPPANILRQIERIAAGEARYSGEMHVILSFVEKVPDIALPLAAGKHIEGSHATA